jgi:glycosyltransferase involved in cell wall biosynthesis
MVAMQPDKSLFVVVPTLNAAAQLSANTTLPQVPNLIISDGGSTDDTLAAATGLQATLIAGERGRGQQLVAGAEAAVNSGAAWLLFLHADTTLADAWLAEVKVFIDSPENRFRAGVFRFHLDDDSAQAGRIARMVDWRNRVLALPYGDQGLLISTEFYRRLGGFRPIAIMEDVDIIRRIGRGRLHFFDSPATTDAGRFIDGGYVLRPLRNLCCVALFFLGAPPDFIRRLYG